MEIVDPKKFAVRMLDLIVILSTIIITPIAINYAIKIRACSVLGGELLIPVLGAVIVMIIETIYADSENCKKGAKNEQNNYQ